AIVALGDSWFDGDGSTSGANHRLPDLLAERLQHDADGVRYGLLNEGVIGNRLLRDSPGRPSQFGDALGESTLRRVDRDALAQPNVCCVIVHVGVNDLGFPGAFTPTEEAITAADLIAGFRRLIASAHSRGIRIVATTLTPFEGATLASRYYTP